MTFRLAVTLSLFAILLAACGGAPAADDTASAASVAEADPAQQQAAVPQQQQPTPVPGAPEGVVAVVNGEPITEEAFNAALARRETEFDAADRETLENFVLNTLINQEVTEQAAVRLEIGVTDEEVQAEINALKGLLDGDEAAWTEWLTVNGYTSETEFAAELRNQLLVSRVRDFVVGDTPQQTTLQVQARHILVETEADALMLRNRLENGEDFVLLAAQFSKDITTKDAGGDLGWFAREELLEPRVAEVAFTQQPGEISMPVATRLGYHIIETLQFDDLPVQPEKQAQIAQGIFDDWLTTETDSAIIEIYR